MKIFCFRWNFAVNRAPRTILLGSLYAATWTREPRGTGGFCLLRSTVGNAITWRRKEPWWTWRARLDVREAAEVQVDLS